MSAATEITLARQVASANALLAQAVSEIRLGIHCGMMMADFRDRPGHICSEPGVGPHVRAQIEGIEEKLNLVRGIEAHLGFAPHPGPEWLDRLVAGDVDLADVIGPVS